MNLLLSHPFVASLVILAIIIFGFVAYCVLYFWTSWRLTKKMIRKDEAWRARACQHNHGEAAMSRFGIRPRKA